jgi:hypothetical protein
LYYTAFVGRKFIDYYTEHSMAIDRFGEIPIVTDQDVTGKGRGEIESGSTPEGQDLPDSRHRPPFSGREKEKRDASVRRSHRRGGSGKQRKSLRFRTIRWLLAPLILIVLYGVGGYFLVPALIKGPVTGMLSERLERPIEVKRIVFAPFTLNLYLEEVSIGVVRGGTGRGGELLACETVRCRLGLKRIIRGRLLCDRINLEQLSLHVRRDEAGLTDVFDILNIFTLQVNREIASVWPAWLDAGELVIRDGTIVFDDDLVGRRYLVEQLELYLPPAAPDMVENERLPEISALINGSPVQAEAVRVVDGKGESETSLALHIGEVMLSSYLDYFPWQDGQYRLTEGRADIDLKIVFPRGRDTTGRFVFSGEAAVTDLQIVDSASAPVFEAPQSDVVFEFVPSARQVVFHAVSLSDPDLIISGNGEKGDGGKDSPIARFFAAIDSFLLPTGRFPTVQFHAVNGTVRLPGQSRTLSGVDFTLRAGNSSAEGEKNSVPATFSFRGVDKQEAGEAQLSAEGQILPGGGSKGRFTATRLDFQHYREFLPGAGLVLDRGVGDIDFAYDLDPGRGTGATASTNPIRVREGKLDVSLFAVSAGKKQVAAGERLRCNNFQTGEPAEGFVCDTLELADSEIFSLSSLPAQSVPSANGKNEPQLVVNNLRIKGSKLHAPIPASLCAENSSLVLENFTLQADNLQGKSRERDNITASATIGSKGDGRITGRYFPAGREGNLQISLRHIDFTLFNPCLSPFMVLSVKQGTMHIQGNVAMPAGEFTGQVWMNDMAAGEEGGPQVAMQLATSEKIVLRADPHHLDLGEIMIRKPVVTAGLSDEEGVLNKFFRPGKLSFTQVSIDKISIEDGRFTLPWPIMLPGYQPEITNMDGAIASPGGDFMPFSFKGRIGGIGEFSIEGETDSQKVLRYRLEAMDVRLEPFADFFRSEIGLAVSGATAAWVQTMNLSADGSEFSTSLNIFGGRPEPDSPLTRVLALLIDEKEQLAVTMHEGLPSGEEHSLLLQLFQRQLLHQSVRADIAGQLVLREYLPTVEFPDHIAFAPGSFGPVEPEMLAGYEELLGRRPYLRLRLQPFVSEEIDAEAMQAVLQQEADLKREEENSRRALERMKLEEREIQRLAAIREGKASVEAEEIDPAELAGGLEPLPYVRVEVTAEMLRELGDNRASAVRDALVQKSALDPDRITIVEEHGKGLPQVKIFLEPHITGRDSEGGKNGHR